MKKLTVVLGITGGIAAYKILDLIKKLRNVNYEVFVVMTDNAQKMVEKDDFAKASNNSVYTELFSENFSYQKILENRIVDHIKLADKADVVLVAPSTANFLAKVAGGIADDFLTTLLLATQAPILVAPSMNVHMWDNEVVQENLFRLQKRGITIIEPEAGPLACGYEGKGRLASTQTLFDSVVYQLEKGASLKGKKILVTAGGTSEPIDAARVITNKSSGKMGVALSKACQARGAEVLLLKSETVVSGQGLPEKLFSSGKELAALIEKHISDFDIIFHTAAVGDFQLEKPYTEKISSKENLSLILVPTKKIVDEIKKQNKNTVLIAFKAVTSDQDIVEKVDALFESSRADAVVVNTIDRVDHGFGADTNEVICVLKNKKQKSISLRPKVLVAEALLDFLLQEKVI